MGENIIKARQTAKIATSSEWEDSTLPLKRGELTINETTGEMRFGDGVDTFNNSPKVKTVPLSHSSSSTEYGVGNGENYGHVKLSDSTNSTSGVTDGTAATPSAVKAAYDLANSKASVSSALIPYADIYVDNVHISGRDDNYVTLECDNIDGILYTDANNIGIGEDFLIKDQIESRAKGETIDASDIDNITETGVYYVEGMINDDNEDEILLIVVRGNTRIAQYTFSDDDTIRYRTKTITGNWASGWGMIHDPHAAPINHASTSEVYGLASATTFGHVRLSDNTTSNANVTAGIAATPAAVKAAYDKANIKKNPDGTTGDIIDTHLTVGTRLEDSDIGSKSFVSGENNEASAGISAVVGGRYNTASGYESVVTGGDHNTASNYNSAVVGGWGNTAGGGYAVILGGSQNNISEESVLAAILGGSVNTASGNNSAVIGGDSNEASGIRSAAVGGNGNTASGTNSASIGGYNNEASAESSVIIGGNYNTALQYQVKTGHYSKAGTAGNSSGTTGDAFIIGNGSSDTSRSNAFRVAYTGSVYALSAFNSTGADYAELLEWEDGNSDNADRRGEQTTRLRSQAREMRSLV